MKQTEIHSHQAVVRLNSEFLAAGGRPPLLPPTDPLHPWQHPSGGLASPLHGQRHPGHRGSRRTPHYKAWVRQPPAAADPGTQKTIVWGPPGQQKRRLRTRVPVHPEPGEWRHRELSESKANKGSTHGALSGRLNKMQIANSGSQWWQPTYGSLECLLNGSTDLTNCKAWLILIRHCSGCPQSAD